MGLFHSLSLSAKVFFFRKDNSYSSIATFTCFSNFPIYIGSQEFFLLSTSKWIGWVGMKISLHTDSLSTFGANKCMFKEGEKHICILSKSFLCSLTCFVSGLPLICMMALLLFKVPAHNAAHQRNIEH